MVARFFTAAAAPARGDCRRLNRLGEQGENVILIGRLGSDRYHMMDHVTGMALAEAEKLATEYRVIEEASCGIGFRNTRGRNRDILGFRHDSR